MWFTQEAIHSILGTNMQQEDDACISLIMISKSYMQFSMEYFMKTQSIRCKDGWVTLKEILRD